MFAQEAAGACNVLPVELLLRLFQSPHPRIFQMVRVVRRQLPALFHVLLETLP